jgi:hypothetical protein
VLLYLFPRRRPKLPMERFLGLGPCCSGLGLQGSKAPSAVGVHVPHTFTSLGVCSSDNPGSPQPGFDFESSGYEVCLLWGMDVTQGRDNTLRSATGFPRPGVHARLVSPAISRSETRQRLLRFLALQDGALRPGIGVPMVYLELGSVGGVRISR